MKFNKASAKKATLSLLCVPVIGYIMLNYPSIIAGLFAVAGVSFIWFILYTIFNDEKK